MSTLKNYAIAIALLTVFSMFFYAKHVKNQLTETQNELMIVTADNATLKLSKSLNSAFTRQQLEYEIQQREKSDATISKLQKSLHGNQCASSRMPDDVINSLRTPNSS